MRRIVRTIKDYAAEKGWKPDQFQILFRNLEDWGRISVFLIAESFAGSSNREIWDEVIHRIDQSVETDGELGFSVGLVVCEESQVKEGGLFSIPEDYVSEEDLPLHSVAVG